MTLVSVVMLTYQRPRRLWQALESIGKQTYPQVEVVVVNNGGVPVDAVIERYEQEFQRPIQYVTLRTPQYLGVASNVGAATAHGEVLALLGDDDRYRPRHLERLMQTLAQKPQAVVAYDEALLMLEDSTSADEDPHVVATCRLGLPYEKRRFEQDDYILTSALAIRRKAFDACGGFDGSLPFVEDWDLLLRLRQHGVLLYVPGEIGVEYSVRTQGTDHIGAVFNQERQNCLDWLTARYELPPLIPKTFYHVARDLGCEIVPYPGKEEPPA